MLFRSAEGRRSLRDIAERIVRCDAAGVLIKFRFIRSAGVATMDIGADNTGAEALDTHIFQ